MKLTTRYEIENRQAEVVRTPHKELDFFPQQAPLQKGIMILLSSILRPQTPRVMKRTTVILVRDTLI